MTPEPGPELEEQPCRFCGAPPTASALVNVVSPRHEGFCVECRACGAQGPIKPTGEEALAAWDVAAGPEVEIVLRFATEAERTAFIQAAMLIGVPAGL